MSQNASSSSQTIPSQSDSAGARKAQILKVEAILDIQSFLTFGEAEPSNEELISTLSTYISILNNIDQQSAHQNHPRGASATQAPNQSNSSSSTSEQDRGQSESDVEFFPTPSIPRDTSRQHSLESKSGDAEKGSKKHHRTSVHEKLFSWGGTSAVLWAGLEPEVQQCLNLLDDWATDPTYVVRKILLSPGCPDFPPDQWLNIVKGYAVDLAKVLGAHYSTDVNTKQSQDLGDLFQISIRVPKQFKAIKTHGDWDHCIWKDHLSNLLCSARTKLRVCCLPSIYVCPLYIHHPLIPLLSHWP